MPFDVCRVGNPTAPTLLAPSPELPLYPRGLGGGAGGTGGGGFGLPGGGGFAGVALPVSGAVEDRSSPVGVVSIAGQDLSDLGGAAAIESVEVGQVLGEIPWCRVLIQLPDVAALGSETWRSGLELDVSTGYSRTAVLSRGTFYVHNPGHVYTPQGQALLELRGVGEAALLHHRARRRQFPDMTESQVATQIAGEYGLTPQVTETKKVSRTVQRGETDAQLLIRLAQSNGFSFSVENGVLIFGPRRFEDSGVVLRYHLGPDSTLHSFRASVDTTFLGGRTVATQVDSLTGEIREEEYDDSEDALAKAGQAMGVSAGGLSRIMEWAQLGGERPQTFVVEEGQGRGADEVKGRVQRWGQGVQWGVEAQAVVFANELVNAGQFVTVEGVGIHSGGWLVTEVLDQFGKDFQPSHRMTLWLRRTWTGSPTGSALPDGAFG